MSEPCQFIGGIAHVNLTVPVGSLPQAEAFYGDVLLLRAIRVPSGQEKTLMWFDCGNGQQIHISYPKDPSFPLDPKASRHPCFKVISPIALRELQERMYQAMQEGGLGAPVFSDKPGVIDSGLQGPEYPKRFFARDYAGNWLEFST